MKRFALPKKVKVGGLFFDIKYPYPFSENLTYYGLCQNMQSEIKIGNHLLGEKLDVSNIVDTYIHEIIHAVDYVYTNYSLKEESVALLSRALIEFFKYNDFNIDTTVIPKEIKIFTSIFKVKDDYVFEEGNKNIIQIDDINNKISIELKKYNLYAVKSMLFECCMSNLLNLYGIDDDIFKEEVSVRAFTSGVYQVVLDNNLEKLIKTWA